ncbi:MAG: bifunctional (p)ppGpp synthetase/guanosine-3',5'-bis(diphosphate) 3'-pyrophosphohydrolase [Pseudomonadota bacterium]|nr:bifunctional (p)ppGpp synthetase/guanosine-3',5'-bis(diphosphate) 3'-pyrophosphohydrolase [Pseudomonadota bacterium]QKK05766.1 MAG: bifunctional (p)ppGpp synthetase/guanosine-3',5'-bis(diphosphate) 3'-pyrophosphohydrolase [Pseudomonadota bacterium]
MIRQYELINRVKAYDPDMDENALNRAYVYAMKMHGTQTRASGDPYFSHPLEVAAILTELKMDTASVITALLHDTVEDTDATIEEISSLFGDEIGKLVDGVTKLSQIELQRPEEKQAENFRKLILAMSEDIRVLLVKLADRLHNMRTLHHISKPDKQKRIARETLEIYVPLAERIGIHTWKEELEDLAFTYLNPEARESIAKRLEFLRSEGEQVVVKIIAELTKQLKAANIDAKITGREKTPHSIWLKMQRKNVSFEQLSDIMAFRVIVDDVSACYHVLGIIHGLYPSVPGRFKDYISIPKANGYHSLHTTVIGPENQRIEMQIRTAQMHEEAEFGVAAHWAYKNTEGNAKKGGKQYRWLRELMDIVEQAARPEEFLQHTKLELFQEQVYCFTPQGDLIELPKGATPVDFAYAVHSQVGDTCVGAKVNGRIVPLNTQLQNGDQVEIRTSDKQTPSPNWERFVVTGKAHARIRRFVRMQQVEQYSNLGKAMLQKICRQENVDFQEKPFSSVVKQFKADSVEMLYTGVGSGHINGREVFKAAFPEQAAANLKKLKQPKLETSTKPKAQKKRKGKASPMPIKGLIPGMALHFARCCHPLPGDKIVGIVTTGKGVTIHTVDCESLESFADTPERWLDVSWDDGEDTPETHIGRLSIVLANEPGSLGTLSTVIGQKSANITNLKIINRQTDFWDILVDVFVHDAAHLEEIIKALRATPEIASVKRTKGR